MKNILFNTSELGAGTRGASLGPEAVSLAVQRQGNAFFDHAGIHRMGHGHDVLRKAVRTPNARYLANIAQWADHAAHQTQHLLAHEQRLWVFSGDHSNAVGLYSGFWEAFPRQKRGLLWVDAHADLHTPYTSPTGNAHGMPVATLLGLSDEGGEPNGPSLEEKQHWRRWQRCGTSRAVGKLHPSEVVFVGLRSVEPEEQFLLDHLGIRYYTAREVHHLGMEQTLREVRQHFAGQEVLYLSFDADVLDPGISTGTGTPVQGGLDLNQAQMLLQSWNADDRCRLLEFTEVNPLLDTENKMAEAVAALLEAMEHEMA